MKWLLKLFEAMRPGFDEGGKFKSMKPAFDAAENIFFAPAARTKVAPHARDPLDVKRFMTMAILALVPSALAGIYFFGLRVIALILVSYVVGGAVEVLFAVVRKEEINEGFLVTGLIYPLVLPPGLPLWMAGVGIAFGVIVGKELFGGTGRNLFNPALVGRAFLAIGYPAAMSGNYLKPVLEWPGRLTEYVGSWNVDAVSAATPLVGAKGGTFAPIEQMLFGNTSGSVGETCAVAIIAGGLMLLFTRVASWKVVASTLGTYAGLGALFHHTMPESFGPVGWTMLAGGLMFGAFFMATDPVTSPITNGAKWMYGILIGTATLLIRNLTGYVEGMMFAILLGNIASPLLDEIVIQIRLRRLRHEA
jgi:Na+-transporting NADH:ubiquinone oxidoreductase subunit B/electron transport complex protein RnfD